MTEIDKGSTSKTAKVKNKRWIDFLVWFLLYIFLDTENDYLNECVAMEYFASVYFG